MWNSINVRMSCQAFEASRAWLFHLEDPCLTGPLLLLTPRKSRVRLGHEESIESKVLQCSTTLSASLSLSRWAFEMLRLHQALTAFSCLHLNLSEWHGMNLANLAGDGCRNILRYLDISWYILIYLDFLNPPFQHVPFQWSLGHLGPAKRIASKHRHPKWSMRQLEHHWWNPLLWTAMAMLGKCTCINYRWISMVYYIIYIYISLYYYSKLSALSFTTSFAWNPIDTYMPVFFCGHQRNSLPSVINTNKGPKNRVVWRVRSSTVRSQRGARYKAKSVEAKIQIGTRPGSMGGKQNYNPFPVKLGCFTIGLLQPTIFHLYV